jgi:DnaJ family protein C protein 14
LGIAGQKLKQYLKGWWKIFTVFLFWLVNLISDVCSLSVHISRDMASSFWLWSVVHWALFLDTVVTIAKRIRILSWIWEKLKKPEKPAKDNNRSFIHSGLQNNINMPTTGEEAMKRLLACKGKDPYSILGVTPTCTDDDIKRYYKRQAFLVHPDKNQQPGAEEAFKILVHAFDMIGEPERRAAYDKGVVESVQVEQAWSELTELLAQLQQKVEAAANTIRCSACGLRHKRIKVDRPCYAARNCSSCKIHHSAREGDIWAEARCFGFLWHYYACMEGNVYDITEWAGCQKDSLKHLRPDSHQVQYRIALGKQASQPRRHSGSLRNEKPPDLENLLNTLYGQTDCTQQGAKRRNKKANK